MHIHQQSFREQWQQFNNPNSRKCHLGIAEHKTHTFGRGCKPATNSSVFNEWKRKAGFATCSAPIMEHLQSCVLNTQAPLSPHVQTLPLQSNTHTPSSSQPQTPLELKPRCALERSWAYTWEKQEQEIIHKWVENNKRNISGLFFFSFFLEIREKSPQPQPKLLLALFFWSTWQISQPP